jgi:hypothetical protein
MPTKLPNIDVIRFIDSAQANSLLGKGAYHTVIGTKVGVVFAILDDKACIINAHNMKVVYCQNPCPFSEEDITFSTTFSTGGSSSGSGSAQYFALGGRDSSILVYSVTINSENGDYSLDVVTQYICNSSVSTQKKKGKSGKGGQVQFAAGVAGGGGSTPIFNTSESILGMYNVPTDCLNRLEANLVYMWAATESQLALVAWRAIPSGVPAPSPTNMSLQAYATVILGSSNNIFGRLHTIESHYTAFGSNTLCALHFLRTDADVGVSQMNVVALDIRHVLHIAESVSLFLFCSILFILQSYSIAVSIQLSNSGKTASSVSLLHSCSSFLDGHHSHIQVANTSLCPLPILWASSHSCLYIYICCIYIYTIMNVHDVLINSN